MFARTILRFAAALVLTSALIGCSESTAPADTGPHFSGRFDLTQAEAQPLPAAVFDGIINQVTPAFHLRVLATGGSISIDANGHYEQHVNHDVMINGAFNGPLTRADRGECTRSGNQFHCESNYLENVVFTATVDGQKLDIAQDLSGEGRVATYRYTWASASVALVP